MVQSYFKRVIDKIKFDFIPVLSIDDNSIFGYKIIKDFSDLGFDDKDEMYQMAFDEGFFEFFVLKLQEKAYTLALEKGLHNTKLFYTLRLNFVKDRIFFFRSIENLVNKFDLKPRQLIFEIKGVSNWQQLSEIIDYMDDGYECIFKENSDSNLNLKILEFLEPDLIEIKSLDSLNILKNNSDLKSKIIFKQSKNKKISKDTLKSMGIDFIYEY